MKPQQFTWEQRSVIQQYNQLLNGAVRDNFKHAYPVEVLSTVLGAQMKLVYNEFLITITRKYCLKMARYTSC
jgi:hypothetical protein